MWNANMLQYEDFYRQHVTNAQIRNGQLYGCCPFHDDGNPSFSVNLQTGQCKCHTEACGFQGNVISFSKRLGVQIPEDLRSQLPKREPTVKIVRKQIVATYPYVDEKGNILFYALRYQPKSFSFAQPNGNGGWIYNIQGVRRVPYKLPQVLAAQEVIVVAGEKDVEKLSDAGFTATTNPMGEGNWRDEYSNYLQGKDVIIVPDNDPAGQQHAEKVKNSLIGKAKTIKVLSLPKEVGEKGDVSDYFDKLKKTPEDLIGLIDATPYIRSVTNIHMEDPCKKKIQEDFPDVYAGVAGEFSELYSTYLESPKQFFYMSFLTCLGSILSDKITLVGELKPQSRFYTVLLGESADVRKSTAIEKTIAFYRDTILAFSDELKICRGVGSAEGLQQRFNDPKNLHNVKKLLLCLDEFKQLINKCTIRGSVLLPCITTLFELNEYESHTKTTSINLENVYLSILAASTTNTYKNAWKTSFTDIGFNNRLFIVPGCGERRYSIPRVIPQAKKTEIQRKLGEMFGLVGAGNLEIPVQPEARALYDKWYFNLPQSIHSKRLDVYALRFMPLLAVNELKREIDIDIVRKAIAICDWQFNMRSLYDPIDADNEIAKMEEGIRRQLKARGPLRDRALKKALHTERKGYWSYKMAIQNLADGLEIGKNNNKEWELIPEDEIVPKSVPI